ncbi:MAG: 16S rRNA (cytosine(967)-C(5))-methyltransferase RsmB [Ruminiclostridium sp.]|nr:16S rRNA (cytosine(967)-C(5))-methyltransferase RsmB [Ruminiclostridium sp.]MBQ8841440.1 16S rRNA (cytosine(967)-C(5))-methyltransferase RsmB [Ruminiclostridium sp.]
MATARKIVSELLIKTEEKGAYSTIVLDAALEKNALSPKDKAFASALFYGVLERKMTLDYIIRCYSKIEYDKIEVSAVQLLRMGLYQLLYMDGVPDNASVNETVKLASQKQKGFINALLRGFIRDGLKIDYGTLEGEAKLSIEYSCPKWLVKMWINRFGEKATVEMLKASFGRPPLYVKVNTLKCTADQLISELKKDGIKAVKNKLLPDCVEIDKIGGVEACRAYRNGLFHVQDISSQICSKIVKPVFGETVLDMCSAPGGKSFSIAEAMGNKGEVYSFDLYDGKISMLRDGAKRLGISIIKASVNDASVYNESIPLADKVLCDVVCSGLGVIRRKPEIKYKKKQALEEIPPIQKQILKTASRYVKPGGTLIYSTCTLNYEENEGVVEEFLKENPDFAPIVVPVDIKGVEAEYCRNFFPQTTGGDGFFVATLRRIS